MIVTVAKPLSVVSNGALVETKENADGTRTFHWKMEQPHSQLPDHRGGVGVRRIPRQGRRSPRRLLRVEERRRSDGPPVHGQDAPDDRLLQRGHGPAVSIPEVCTGVLAGIQRRDGEHLGHVDDRRCAAGRDRGPRARSRRPGRPRAGPPVVRRPDDVQGLVAHLAQRGVRVVLRPAVHRARTGRGRVPDSDARPAPGATRAATASTAGRSSSRGTPRRRSCSTACPTPRGP